MADYLIPTINDHRFIDKRIRGEDSTTINLGKTGNKSPELQEYIARLKRKKIKFNKVGAIVMNCNPFTKGHYYLIETAAKSVEKLWVFVVEEDKSLFPFEDRIRLVREGTKRLNNVYVVPSGQYILSQNTFKEYFTKDDVSGQQNVIDPSEALRLFGEFIVPALGIDERFVGEEPLDYVTSVYNTYMQELLPKYGCRVTVVPRKKTVTKL